MSAAFQSFYHYFRLFNLEGIIQFIILSYVLCLLCGMKKPNLKKWHYVCGTTLLFAGIQWVVRFVLPITYSNLLGTQELPYWFNFVSNIGITILCAYFLLNNTFAYKMTYILFFMAFILLFKVVCSPFYELEDLMSPFWYQVIDLFTIGVLFASLFLLTFLFRKHQLQTSIHLSNKAMGFTLYFPISILVCYTLTTNSHKLYPYTNPMIALIILSDLPMIYYILCIIMKSYEEQRRLDDALTQTKAQLSRFRFSIELQDRLKKERHELKNNYFYIQTLLNEKKYDQLNDYMENVIGEKLSSLN